MPSPEFVAALQHFPKDIAVPGDSYAVVRQKFEPAHGHDPTPVCQLTDDIIACNFEAKNGTYDLPLFRFLCFDELRT